ncbi:MAG: stage II sporulation protein M [Bacillota bacterium]|nr:stage II sporulation protein M [Bacillota bacterium]
MKEQQFIRTNSNTWKELEKFSFIINKRGVKSLPSGEIKRFLHLFRLSSHHLAYARTHYPQSSTVSYLNSVIGKCHSHIYAVRKASPMALIRYITYGFPNLLKDSRAYVTAAFFVFLAGFLASLLIVWLNAENAAIFLPQQYIDSVKSTPTGAVQANSPLMAGIIMTNNIKVSLMAFALGITLGIGTIYVLFENGAMLGALTALVYQYSDPVRFWSLILPHGVIELTAIFISGAAGFIIAKSILIPGEYTRVHSLISGAKRAVSHAWGIIFLLIIAGTIEGFFTPSGASASTKLAFAAFTAVLLFVYFSIPYLRKKKLGNSSL